MYYSFIISLSSPVGDFVAVIYDETWWAGEIASVEEGRCLIKFMVRKGPNRFTWPAKEETDWIAKKGIFARFPSPPVPVSHRYVGFEPQAFLCVIICRQVSERE